MTGPTAESSSLRLARPPVGLLGMLALVVLVEVIIGLNRLDIVSPSAEDWRFATWAAERKAPGSEVLCFGDSLIKYGVLPQVIEGRAGLKAYNLATSGGTMPSEYFLFKRALDSGARPRAIVADFAALMLNDSAPLDLQNYPELATLTDCAGLAWADRDPRFLAAATLAKVVPSYRWRFEVRGLIRAAFEGRSGSQRRIVNGGRHKWEKYQGAQPMAPGRTHHPSEDYLIDGVSPASWAIEPRNAVYLDRFLGLARERAIPVYWVIPPLSSGVHARRGQRGADATYDRLVRSELAKFPEVVVLDARPAGYADSVYLDHIHLDQVGASVLSGDIADVLVGRSGRGATAGSWVALPPYAGRTEVAARGSTVR